MAKKKYHWYVLVMTQTGPTFVTEVDWGDKTAHWDRKEKPLEMDERWAKDLALGLTANFYSAFAVCSLVEWKGQPYRYDIGHFVWEYYKEDTKNE